MYKFTNKAKQIIEHASHLARKLGHRYIGTEHILYGLIKEEGGARIRECKKTGSYMSKN